MNVFGLNDDGVVQLFCGVEMGLTIDPVRIWVG